METEVSKIVNIMEMGEGTRAEIDFVDNLAPDEGILVGDKAKGFFLILAETRTTETYPARPFRVNAGAIHQYICMANDETSYLSELKSGDRVLVTNGRDERLVAIGRVKIEKREFLRIELENGVTATLQKADSVYISGDTTVIHMIDCKVNDKVNVYVSADVARHKGKIIKEEIQER